MTGAFNPLLLLLVAVGGAIGGLLRHGIATAVDRAAGTGFPWGILAVNVSGAFLLGAAVPALHAGHPAPWAFAAIGILGSYTTVSSFALQTLAMWQARRRARAAGNVLLSLTLCLASAAAGLALAGAIAGAAS